MPFHQSLKNASDGGEQKWREGRGREKGSIYVVVINSRICKLLLRQAVETEPGLVGKGMCGGGGNGGECRGVGSPVQNVRFVGHGRKLVAHHMYVAAGVMRWN